jgi:hypothetical protein
VPGPLAQLRTHRRAARLRGPQRHLARPPAEFGRWNSVWKRFWRLSRAGVFEAFFPGKLAESPIITNPFGIESVSVALAFRSLFYCSPKR